MTRYTVNRHFQTKLPNTSSATTWWLITCLVLIYHQKYVVSKLVVHKNQFLLECSLQKGGVIKNLPKFEGKISTLFAKCCCYTISAFTEYKKLQTEQQKNENC